jgi:molecular chaperone DnaJ
MSEDYYDILGVGKDADPQTIRKAYRREAKKFHPDTSGGEGSSGGFRRLEEAYQILSDARKRRAYDEEERERNAASIRSPFSPVYQPGPSVPGTPEESSEPLLEVLLSPEEAACGVAIPVDIPLRQPCPRCSGQGFWERLFCFTCSGTGGIRSVDRISLQIPPGIQSGREFRVVGGDFAGRSFRVRVLVN